MQRNTVITESYEGTIAGPLKKRSTRTPDFNVLRSLEKIPVFVYDSMQRNGINSFFLDDAIYLGKAHTFTPFWKMYINKQQPIVFKAPTNVDSRQRVRGEVYLCSVEHIHTLDVFNSNTLMFERTKTRVYLEDQSSNDFSGSCFQGIPFTKAFLYTGVEEYWEGIKDIRLSPSVTYHTESKIIGNKTFFEYNYPKKVIARSTPSFWSNNDSENLGFSLFGEEEIYVG